MRHPDYEDAYWGFVSEVLNGFDREDDLLSRFRFEITQRSGPIRTLQHGVTVDIEMTEMSADWALSFEDMRNCNVDAITASMFDLAQQRIEAITYNILQALHTVTEATGQVFDARGAPISIDMVLDMLETMEVSFNEDGKCDLVFLAPEGNNLTFSAEQQARFDQIIGEKKRVHDATKRSRRLPPTNQ